MSIWFTIKLFVFLCLDALCFPGRDAIEMKTPGAVRTLHRRK